MTLWYITDTHFQHSNILTFKKPDGSLIRPGFSSIEEHDEHIIEEWNKVVKPSDHIYHLGDVTFNQKAFHAIMPRLRGVKRLLLGNHDNFKMGVYSKYFGKVQSMGTHDKLLFTHLPVHPSSVSERWRANVHGHIHASPAIEGKYVCICPEHLGFYRPISLEEVKERVDKL